MTTASFVDQWADGKDSFEADPPNAVLSVPAGDQSEEVVVVLRQPRLEGVDLIYDVEVLEGEASLEGGPVSLFIDVIGRPLTPMSVAGVRRRERRRVVRHELR